MAVADSSFKTPFQPKREAALDSLKRFVPRTGVDYARLRNFDFGPDDRSNVSTLSPYLRNRLLSEIEVARAVLAQNSYAEAEKFLQEVFWRTYWKGYLENRPQLWDQYRADLGQLLPQHEDSEAYQSAVAGKTGIDCFDFWIHELVTTGYLHNHARMWFASIWIFTLKLPWQLGADFFFRHLLDGDPASNTLSWRWVAGLHTKGKTYLATAGNIARYTDERFPDTPKLASQPSLIDDPHETPNPNFIALPDANELPTENAALLLLDEDLGGDLSELPRTEQALGLYLKSGYEHHRLSQAVKTFRASSLKEQLRHLVTNWAAQTDYSEKPSAENIIDWAKQKGVQTLILAQPQVGPWRDQWNVTKPQLQAAGLTICEFRPWWEERLFPQATAGFFKFKKQIPKLLESRTPA